MKTILLHTQDERLSQADFRIQENHINVEEIKIDPQNHDYLLPTTRNYLIHKMDMRKFDGKDHITWIF